MFTMIHMGGLPKINIIWLAGRRATTPGAGGTTTAGRSEADCVVAPVAGIANMCLNVLIYSIFIWNILIKLSTSGRLINNNVNNVQYFHGAADSADHIFVNKFIIDWAGVVHIRTLKTRTDWSGVRRPRRRSSCPRPPTWRTSPGSPPASSSPPRPCPPPAARRVRQWPLVFDAIYI